MSDTTETETETGTNTDTTDEPSKAELHERVEQLELTVEKLMPSRRDALRMGVAGLAGAAGLSATSGSASASTGSAGQIGDSSNRPDAFLDEANVNQLTGVSTGADRQGCRVFLSNDQNFNQKARAKIQFDAESYDSDNNFDLSTHAWTCPKDGLYAVNLQVGFVGGGNDEERALRIGTATSVQPVDGGAFNRQTSSDIGDVLTLFTVNKYSSGDTIATYANNIDSDDTLDSGSVATKTFLEVAFLGGL